MNRYQVLVKGENFLLDFVDEERKSGFYIMIWVEAENPEEAEMKAIDIVRRQKDLKTGLLNDPEDTPIICIEEIYELESNAVLKKNSGKAFFIETDDAEVKYYVRKRWWEFWL